MARAAAVTMMLVSAAAYAFAGLAALKRRLRVLRELTRAMLHIASGIEFSQTSLSVLFAELSKRSGGAVGKMFEDMAHGIAEDISCAELWRRVLEKNLGTAEECEIFLPMAGCLGMTDRSVQLKTLEMVISDAREYEKCLKERIERYKAVDMRVCMMCGAAAVIVLI